MHIPDGFLDTRTAVTTAALSAVGVSIAVRSLKSALTPGAVPLMGLTAAFVFVAQTINFPIGAGTSGHLLGGVLAAILVGPRGAILVMTSVLVIQALLFADGGLLALGANLFNLALVAPLSGYWIAVGIRRLLPGEAGKYAAPAFGAWASTVIAAVLCAAELAWSGTAAWSAVFPAMTTVHIVVGIGEGLITALVIAALERVRPDLLLRGSQAPSPLPSIVLGLTIILGFALFVSPFASEWPDGLERIAGLLGFESRAIPQSAPMAEYRLPGIGSVVTATSLAIAAGTALVFAGSLLLGRLLATRRSSPDLKG
jgi:cobalt/nickel transport system permease protein